MKAILDINIKREDHQLFNEQIKNIVKDIDLCSVCEIDETSSIELLKNIERISYFIQQQLRFLAVSIFLDDIHFEESYSYTFKIIDYLKKLNLVCFLKHKEFKKHPNYEQFNKLLTAHNKKNNEVINDVKEVGMGVD